MGRKFKFLSFDQIFKVISTKTYSKIFRIGSLYENIFTFIIIIIIIIIIYFFIALNITVLIATLRIWFIMSIIIIVVIVLVDYYFFVWLEIVTTMVGTGISAFQGIIYTRTHPRTHFLEQVQNIISRTSSGAGFTLFHETMKSPSSFWSQPKLMGDGMIGWLSNDFLQMWTW